MNHHQKKNVFLLMMGEYLHDHDKVSDENARKIMRQVRKLAYGKGIRYDSVQYGWPPNKYFAKDRCIDPTLNIIKLLVEAQRCEDIYGRDHGNGWLLSHPLKKLYNFQQFLLLSS